MVSVFRADLDFGLVEKTKERSRVAHEDMLDAHLDDIERVRSNRGKRASRRR